MEKMPDVLNALANIAAVDPATARLLALGGSIVLATVVIANAIYNREGETTFTNGDISISSRPAVPSNAATGTVVANC